MTRGGWRLYNVYIITGMALFFTWAFLGDRGPPEENWEEFAHYDPAMVEGGIIRGTVRWKNAADCTAKARSRYHYEWADIVGSDVPADGINGPYIWGCARVTYDGKRLNEIRR